MNKSTIKNAPNPTSSGSGEGKHDLIDRQAAIETAIEAADEWDGGTSFSRDGIIERRLKMIPADHVADIGKKAEGDCISRQAAIDVIMGQPPEPHYPPWYATQIEKLPAVQPDHNADIGKKVDVDDCISRRAVIDALHTWFRDGFDEDKWWNSTHVLAAIEGLPSVQQGYKWETCFDCPLSHGCPKIKGCTNEQAVEYASQIPNDCPLPTQPNHTADIGKKVSISDNHENDVRRP